MTRIIPTTFALVGLLALSPIRAPASPSGLNNIPTADTAGNQVLVLQEYTTFGEGRGPDHSAGFKFGLAPAESHRFEVGMDGRFAPDNTGPAVFQAKYAIQPDKSGPAFSIGTANVALSSGGRDRVGQTFTYGVLSHDVPGVFRLHGGYAIQKRNDTVLLGIDKSFKVSGRDFMLRGDVIQIQNRDQWLASAGFLYVFHQSWALESWISIPTDHGKPSFTIKLNWIFDLK